MRRKTERRPLWLALGLFAYACVAVTGIEIAGNAAEMRELFIRLEAVRDIRDGHLEEYRYLLLERATLESYQDVDRVAAQELAMRFPDRVRVVR